MVSRVGVVVGVEDVWIGCGYLGCGVYYCGIDVLVVVFCGIVGY